jgi:hypothetical protein
MHACSPIAVVLIHRWVQNKVPITELSRMMHPWPHYCNNQKSPGPLDLPPPLLLTMCYYTFAGVRFACGHTMPIRLERLVHPCEDIGCRTSLTHPQPCDGCMETYYTILNVDSSCILNCASRECNPCRIYQAQQEGRTPIRRHRVRIRPRIPHS